MEINGFLISKTDMVTKKNSKKLHTNRNKCQVEKCPALSRWNLISTCNCRVRSVLAGWGKFHPSKLGSCNHHLNLYWHHKMSAIKNEIKSWGFSKLPLAYFHVIWASSTHVTNISRHYFWAQFLTSKNFFVSFICTS